MTSRYWAYTTRIIPREPVPAENEKVHNGFLQFRKNRGDEYEAHCMEASYEFGCPEDILQHINWLFSNTPEEVMVDKRPITKEEFTLWRTAFQKLRDEQVAYIRGERGTRSE